MFLSKHTSNQGHSTSQNRYKILLLQNSPGEGNNAPRKQNCTLPKSQTYKSQIPRSLVFESASAKFNKQTKSKKNQQKRKKIKRLQQKLLTHVIPTNGLVKRNKTSVANKKNNGTEISKYNVEYQLIARLHGLQGRGIQTQVLIMPHASKVKAPSEWEQWLCSSHWWFVTATIKNNTEYLKIRGLEDKYTHELFVEGSLVDNGQIKFRDYYVRVDTRSRYVNIINHIRPAVGIPEMALNNIRIVGDCTALGVLVMDEDTIGSYLQVCVNRANAYYSVLTHAAWGSSAQISERRLRDIPVSQGDIVVIIGVNSAFGLFFDASCKENNIPIYCTQPNFERPHCLGEVFLDKKHTNSKGNKKAGEILFEKLFINPMKLHTTAMFKHFFRGVLSHAESTWDRVWKDFSSNAYFMLFIQNLEKHRGVSEEGGTVVMNCNPFTLGHLYLLETAATQVDILFVFVVEEDRSEFPFSKRFGLVVGGVTHLPHVVILPSGQFIISAVTLPEYFVKDQSPNIRVDATMDVEIFCRWIAPALGVCVRFVGEEPFDRVTLQYNNIMQRMMPTFDLRLKLTPRKFFGGTPISASRVRLLLKKGQFEVIASIVPESTFSYLQKKCKESLEKKK